MNDVEIEGPIPPIVGFMNWMPGTDWVASFQDHCGEFFFELEDIFKAPSNEVVAMLPTYLWTRAMGLCVEDFATVEYNETPSNPLDQYLEEEGESLDEISVEILIRLRSSTVHLYSVVDRTVGGLVELKDLTGDPTPIFIEDDWSTAFLQSGDRIATRIAKFEGKHILVGTVLALSQLEADTFLEGFQTAVKEELRQVPKYLQKDMRQKNLARQRVLRDMATVFAVLWIMEMFRGLDSLEEFVAEDEPDDLYEATFPLRISPESVKRYLDSQDEIDHPVSKEAIWFWVEDRANPEAGLRATIWLGPENLMVESCYLSRLLDAIHLLQESFPVELGEPTLRDVNAHLGGMAAQFADEEDVEDDEHNVGPLIPMPRPGEDVEAFRQRMHAFLTEIYGKILDEEHVGLGNKVPRELATTSKGRKQLSKWLTSVESKYHSDPSNPGMGDYDMRWMWKELGIESQYQNSLFD